jgi:anti-sigma B factor antagonist
MLKVRIENLGQTAILHVRGHIVIGTETEVLRKAVLAQTGVSAVVLDLSAVSRIDARGLGLLLELREHLQSRGIEFRLMNVSSLVEQILKLTCLDGVFETAREQEVRSPDSLELVLEESIS